MTLEEEHEKHLQEVLANWAKVLGSIPHTLTLEDRVAKLEARYVNDNDTLIEIMQRIASLEVEVSDIKNGPHPDTLTKEIDPLTNPYHTIEKQKELLAQNEKDIQRLLRENNVCKDRCEKLQQKLDAANNELDRSDAAALRWQQKYEDLYSLNYSLNPPTKKGCSEEMVYSVLNNLRDVLRRVDNARHTHTSITLEDVTKLVYILEDYKRL